MKFLTSEEARTLAARTLGSDGRPIIPIPGSDLRASYSGITLNRATNTFDGRSVGNAGLPVLQAQADGTVIPVDGGFSVFSGV